MRTDNYLNLCLVQAAKSPLRYRHGAIIVRGGKIIGQGYNDYRTGFDGGALKTGSLPFRSLDSLTIAELKERKNLRRGTQKESAQQPMKASTPLESMAGGGKLVNTPLSMHSEMMAIQSALSVAGSTAASAASSRNSCFKLSGDSKRKARLRREAIKLYVETVCKQSTAVKRRGESQVQEWRFEQSAPGSSIAESCVSRGGERERDIVLEKQYSETPNEKREQKSSSQRWSQVQQWTTQTETLAACT
jgi:deoxycytidylate deaminase